MLVPFDGEFTMGDLLGVLFYSGSREFSRCASSKNGSAASKRIEDIVARESRTRQKIKV
jgi:hypothetical protein